MAIDANILLKGIVPNLGQAVSQGFNIGQAIKQAPLRNQLLEMQTQQQGQAVGQNAALAAFQIFGDTPANEITQDQFNTAMDTAAKIGIPLDEAQRAFNPQNVGGMASLAQAGKQILAQNRAGAGQTGFQTNAPVITERDGQKFFTAFQTDRATGKPSLVEVPISGELVDRMGLTAGDQVSQIQQEVIAEVTAKTNAEAELADISADTSARIKKAEEEAKLEQQLSFKPRIQKAMARATDAADDEAKLKALQANLPLVNDMAGKLRALSSDATHTFGGKAFDFLAKESGFGATKGSTARAKYQAIIDNQILPLLKVTFGAAFTAVEGEKLANTLGDVNASPGEKMAQLDAFLDAQNSQITALETKLTPAGASSDAQARLNALRAKAGF